MILKELKKRNQDQNSLKKQLITDEKKVLSLQKQQDLIRSEISDNKNQIIHENKNLNEFSNIVIQYSENQKYNNSQIDYYSDQISEIISNSQHSNDKIKELEKNLDTIKLNIKENSNNFSIFDKKYAKDIKKRENFIKENNKESDKLDLLFKKKIDLASKINLLDSKIKNYKSHLIDLEKFKYDKNCKYCIKNGHNQINEKKDIKRRLKKNQDLLKKTKTEQSRIIKNYNNQDNLLKKLKESLLSYNKKNEEINQSFHELKIDKIKLTKEKEGVEYRLNYFLESKENLFKKKQELTDNIGLLKKKNIEIDKNTKEANKNREKVKKILIRLNQKNRKLEDKYEAFLIKLKDSQEGLLSNQKLNEEKIINKQKYEIELSNLDNEIKIINNSINEKYSIRVPNDIKFQKGFDFNKLKEEINKHKVSISNIGPINMEVKFEYEKENERFDFLNKQKSDLDNSKKSLNKTILKLDKEAKKKYLDTFNIINKHLETTFSMFFEGGECYLNLLDKDNPLESNIEIFARPPGKKVKKLRVLSAGEKALTAISILFAIYLKKPSPFCVLDEVDAPLDDNNTIKFTNVLKEFSKKTQFIIITHNKLTMNQSSLLYGITQQEQGISQIVSVKLD